LMPGSGPAASPSPGDEFYGDYYGDFPRFNGSTDWDDSDFSYDDFGQPKSSFERTYDTVYDTLLQPFVTYPVLLGAVVLIGLLCCYQTHRRRVTARKLGQRSMVVDGSGLEMQAADDDDGSTANGGMLGRLGASLGLVGGTIKIYVELDGVTHTIAASMDPIQATNHLPLLLTESFEASGAPELRGIDLIDLMMNRRADITFIDPSGKSIRVGATTTLADLKAAKSFRVVIHAAVTTL